MRKPLLVATAISLFLHSAAVLALVSIPASPPVPDLDGKRVAAISLSPQFAPVAEQAPPAPVFLQESRPAEQLASDVPEPSALPTVSAAEVDPRTASIPKTTSAETLTQTLPEAKLSAPVDAAKPVEIPALRETQYGPASQTSGSDNIASASLPAEPETRDSKPAETAAGTGTRGEALPVAPDAAAIGVAEAATGSEARPDAIEQFRPSAPLFPSEPTVLGSSPGADTLSLPVIASDDVGILPPDGAQALSPSELPAISDTGPTGEANAAGAGAASRAKTLIPPAPKRVAPDEAAKGARSANGRPGDGKANGAGNGVLYDPTVRARYSTSLFTYLRRKLVFPSSRPTGTTTVRFILDRSGRILQAGVVGSSGSAELDDQALTIVQRAAPYPRFPEGFGSSQLEVTLPVTFK